MEFPEQNENTWITVKTGEKIRKAREDKGLTQSALAGLLNASRTQIANYEKGEADMPVSRLFDMAGILGTTVADLLAE